ncbi:MAG TPA: serine/threonine-protein kinase [Planctomycetota bacterium]|nr:serine/threonine-protein kinase [Planctomycetota bacterium]
MTLSPPRPPHPSDPSGETAASEIVSGVAPARPVPTQPETRRLEAVADKPGKDDGASVRTMTGSSLHDLALGDAESSLQTLSLGNFRGADHAEDLKRQLADWHRAFTSHHARPRFLLDKRLGEGAQGVIFGVLDRDCRRTVALKTLHSSGVDATEVSRFIHEAQITAQLEHPGIVPVHDFGALPDGTVFYTMKRVEGESLAAYMHGRVADPKHRFDLMQLFLRVCETVGFAHSRGVIHRDLKPRNIMVGAFGEVLVMDWGLAKILGDDARAQDASRVTSLRQDGGPTGSDVHRTLDGFAVGTPAYMSPEQARGADVGPASDVYAVGAVGYFLLTGRPPFEGRNALELLQAHQSAAVTPPSSVNPAVPADLEAVVLRCLAKAPADRFARAAELDAALAACRCAADWSEADAAAWWGGARGGRGHHPSPS